MPVEIVRRKRRCRTNTAPNSWECEDGRTNLIELVQSFVTRSEKWVVIVANMTNASIGRSRREVLRHNFAWEVPPHS